MRTFERLLSNIVSLGCLVVAILLLGDKDVKFKDATVVFLLLSIWLKMPWKFKDEEEEEDEL